MQHQHSVVCIYGVQIRETCKCVVTPFYSCMHVSSKVCEKLANSNIVCTLYSLIVLALFPWFCVGMRAWEWPLAYKNCPWLGSYILQVTKQDEVQYSLHDLEFMICDLNIPKNGLCSDLASSPARAKNGYQASSDHAIYNVWTVVVSYIVLI